MSRQADPLLGGGEDRSGQGARVLDESPIGYYDRRSDRILRQGRKELPVIAAVPREHRGRTKRHMVYNLHARLKAFKPEALAFVYDLTLPFDNNLAERDVRMVKIKQKVSGCFRSARGAPTFCRIRGYISTAKKQGRNVFGALRDAFDCRAFDPSATPIAKAA